MDESLLAGQEIAKAQASLGLYLENLPQREPRGELGLEPDLGPLGDLVAPLLEEPSGGRPAVDLEAVHQPRDEQLQVDLLELVVREKRVLGFVGPGGTEAPPRPAADFLGDLCVRVMERESRILLRAVRCALPRPAALLELLAAAAWAGIVASCLGHRHLA